MTGLPKGWELSTIGEVGGVGLGRQRSPQHHSGPNMRPYLRSANVTWRGIDISDVNEMNFDPADAATFELLPGDLLLNEASGSPNEVGKPAIWRGEIDGCCFQNTLLRVRSKEVLTEYLYWFCMDAALAGRFGEAGRGVNIRHLGKHGLVAFPIPIPPRAEQARIVSAVEEHLSRLDAAEAAAKSARSRLTRFADAALESIFRRTWERVPLDAVNEPGRPICYGILKPKTPGPGEVPYVEVRSIAGRLIKVAELHKTTRDMHCAFLRSELRANDVVLAIRGSFDRAAVVPESLTGANVSRDVARISPTMALVPSFLSAFLVSPEARKFFTAHARGVAVQGVNIRDLRRLPVPVPSLTDQAEAVRRIDAVSVAGERIQAEIRRAETRARILRQSVLAAAFSGQLVPQESDDEPASMLLARIRADRAASVPLKRPRRVKAS